MTIYLIIGWILSIIAGSIYTGFKILKLIKMIETLRQTGTALASKVTELELKQVEFEIKEAEYQEKDQENTKTITVLEKLVAAQDKLLDAYRDNDLY
jgi:hypothetical protein